MGSETRLAAPLKTLAQLKLVMADFLSPIPIANDRSYYYCIELLYSTVLLAVPQTACAASAAEDRMLDT